MARYEKSATGMPSSKERMEEGHLRRPKPKPLDSILDGISNPDTVTGIMALGVLALVVFPQIFYIVVPLLLIHYLICSRLKYQLSYRIPENYGGTDYSETGPGGKGFKSAKGTMFLGATDPSPSELWVTDSDITRHFSIIGTTGSGKALPLDALVLTPRGWVRNGDLAIGDEVVHPTKGTSKILSIHPQGPVRAVRLTFADGRETICSHDHLWHVRPIAEKVTVLADGEEGRPILPDEGKIMEAGDLGILYNLYRDTMRLAVPLPSNIDGAPAAGRLTAADAARFAARGQDGLDYAPSLIGTGAERRAFVARVLDAASGETTVTADAIRVTGLPEEVTLDLKRVARSLGGIARSVRGRDGSLRLEMLVPDMEDALPEAGICRFGTQHPALEIVGVEPIQTEDGADVQIPMSCIKTDRDDGLYITDDYVVTHNTELLLGICSQSLMWSSGFLFIDGKGDKNFYIRVWGLCRRFGREDDVRLINYADLSAEPDARAGGPDMRSNTMNPFATGTADQIVNIIVSLMGSGGQSNDMWKNRAEILVTTIIMSLCELRDRGEIVLNVQTIREFLTLGTGVDKSFLKSSGTGRGQGAKIERVEDVPQEAWEKMRGDAGMIELYLRSLNGDLSQSASDALSSFFNSLPGFNIQKALSGEMQDTKANEQYNFLFMQLTKPLGMLADSYGHIFKTPMADVDLEDVVKQRRILIVLLPALQKAEDEMQACGKIVVALLKMMMGINASGEMTGNVSRIMDQNQSASSSPFIIVLDEVGYYMVQGIDVMMAQARSLKFMMILAAQDMAAMQKVDEQIAETAMANSNVKALGKLQDADKTLQFAQRVLAKAKVPVTSGYTRQANMFGGTKMVEREDVSLEEVDKVSLQELQGLEPGQFYFLLDGKVEKARTFFIGEDFSEDVTINKFVPVRGPLDREPGLDQSPETAFIEGLNACYDRMMTTEFSDESVIKEIDGPLADAARCAARVRASAPSRIDPGTARRMSVAAAILSVAEDDGMSSDEADEDDEDDIDAFYDIEMDDTISEKDFRDLKDAAAGNAEARKQPSVSESIRNSLEARTERERHESITDVLSAERRNNEQTIDDSEIPNAFAAVPPDEEPDVEKTLQACFSTLAETIASRSRKDIPESDNERSERARRILEAVDRPAGGFRAPGSKGTYTEILRNMTAKDAASRETEDA